MQRAAALLSILLVAALPACGVGSFVEDLMGSEFDTPAGESMTDGERLLALEVLALVNDERAQRETAPLIWDDLAADVAYDHCVDMRLRGFYAHDDPDGVTPCERMQAAGVDMAYCAGENIAMLNKTPADVMQAWMQSDGHRAAILSPNVTHIGIGVHTGSGGPWWTQEFFVRLDD